MHQISGSDPAATPDDAPRPASQSPAATSARLYESDRDVALQMTGLGLDPALIARANRRFVERTVRRLAGQGITQFLDIGCGLPPENGLNTQRIAESVHPGTARTLYVDNDPMVLAQADALMRGEREDATAAVLGDVAEPGAVLDLIPSHLDPARPVGLLLAAVLHYVVDDQTARSSVQRLTHGLADGSAVVISHMTDTYAPGAMRRAEAVLRRAGVGARIRPENMIREFFDALELADPGLVPVNRWCPDDDVEAAYPVSDIHVLGGLGRKIR
ncbi:SAM-dependent methyltransferase [Streptomyces yaizuensis]|uniref:SAM-dependent methyltransferase n=1 Tax=Streptomyces yaizuensis TaxID=2989713 RepID=A0ABQ5P7B1_9ACTN|nr:SAM-dependent methyltransferase [Streptomyces sp. YSPA8]GLF98121.1 SAM-dependent methyltransferase [Streptomyces sp. YSPA8]